MKEKCIKVTYETRDEAIKVLKNGRRNIIFRRKIKDMKNIYKQAGKYNSKKILYSLKDTGKNVYRENEEIK